MRDYSSKLTEEEILQTKKTPEKKWRRRMKHAGLTLLLGAAATCNNLWELNGCAHENVYSYFPLKWGIEKDSIMAAGEITVDDRVQAVVAELKKTDYMYSFKVNHWAYDTLNSKKQRPMAFNPLIRWTKFR